jgi:hypoxia up-regulated 1
LVQAAVKSALKGNEDKIAQNVNTDEAAVLGAAFYGASQGRSVKSKIRLKVVEGLGWNVDYVLDKASGWKVVDQEKGDFLFPAGTAHSTKKVLTFAKDLKSGSSDSLSLNLNYVDSNA